MTPILQCTNLTKQYAKQPALTELNLQLERGRIIGLLGPNGSGKTTLIKMIAGLLTPTSGEILVNGEQIGTKTKAVVSYLPDKLCLSENMRVCDCVAFYKDFYTDFDKEKADAILASLKLDGNMKIRSMSKGMKEKLQLALVMSRNAMLYVLDEPIGGVDPAARDFILDTIIKNYNENSTVIISTHLISDIEKYLDEVIIINDGRLIAHKSVDSIREENHNSVDGLFREVFKC